MREFDGDFKRKVVKAYLAGEGGNKLLAARFKIGESMVRRWVAAYRHHGDAGLVRKRGSYTLAFKIEVVLCGAAENMSCRQLAARYNIANPHSIETWRRQHARGELQPKVNASLERSDSMATKTKAPPRSSGTGRPTEEDRLLEENHRLRAEVAYLKKVEALVLAKKLAHQKERK